MTIEETIKEYFKDWSDYEGWDSSVCLPNNNVVTLDDIKEVARYFYNLSKSENNEQY